MKKEKIAVFCGSRTGVRSVYMEAAKALGRKLAQEERTVLFGGCDSGLMQAVSQAAYEQGGKVVSVRIRGLEDAYDAGIIHEDEQMSNVQLRKRRLIERADACLVLPGGLGTLDEMGDVYAMAQLGDIRRPMGILNLQGYYDGFLQWVDTMHREGFLSDRDRQMILVEEDMDRLLQKLDGWEMGEN